MNGAVHLKIPTEDVANEVHKQEKDVSHPIRMGLLRVLDVTCFCRRYDKFKLHSNIST
jgi:hypothetical protein